MAKTINLEEILMKSVFKDIEDVSVSYDDKGKRDILEAMKEAIRQALELASDSDTKHTFNNKVFVRDVDILNTINQIV